MLQTLSTSLAGKLLVTMLISMTPVLELRAGIPAGVAMGLSPLTALLVAFVGNALPVPLVILFTRKVFRLIRTHLPWLEARVTRLEQKLYAKSEKIVRYQTWGLLVFVAIPLPGTGAWTGAMIAALLDLRLKNAVPAILIGVGIAGLIITILTYGVTQLL